MGSANCLPLHLLDVSHIRRRIRVLTLLPKILQRLHQSVQQQLRNSDTSLTRTRSRRSWKSRFRSALKNRAAETDETPRQAIFNNQRTITRETAASIPVYTANQRTVNRVRQNTRPQMPEPTSLAGFEIIETLQQCPSGEKFLYFDTGIADEDRILVFATLSAIDILSEATHWFWDGTFSTSHDAFFPSLHCSRCGWWLHAAMSIRSSPEQKTNNLRWTFRTRSYAIELEATNPGQTTQLKAGTANLWN